MKLAVVCEPQSFVTAKCPEMVDVSQLSKVEFETENTKVMHNHYLSLLSNVI